MTATLCRVPRARMLDAAQAAANGEIGPVQSFAEATTWAFRRDVVESLCNYVIKKWPNPSGVPIQKSQMDAYLAPRLHAALRIPRRLAADPGVWAWLAADPCRAYILHRFGWEEGKSLWRFADANPLRNGVARLWWGAEMLRDGPDYSLVPKAFATVRRYEFVGELVYSWHRECARAFTKVTDQHGDEGERLSPLFNTYLRTQSLESYDTAYSDAESRNWDAQWAGKEVDFEGLNVPIADLKGPSQGRARPEVEDALVVWLDEVYAAIHSV